MALELGKWPVPAGVNGRRDDREVAVRAEADRLRAELAEAKKTAAVT